MAKEYILTYMCFFISKLVVYFLPHPPPFLVINGLVYISRRFTITDLDHNDGNIFQHAF